MAVILERGVPTTIYVDGTMTHYLSDSADKQPKDDTLTALAALDASAGLVEQTGADAFTKRPMGVSASTDVLTRADGDGRYAGIRLAYRIITSNATLASTDEVIFADTTSGAITLALPTAVGLGGKVVEVSNEGTGFHRLIIDPASTETIGGQPTLELADGERARFLSDNANWRLIP